jgi:hypothetical protein
VARGRRRGRNRRAVACAATSCGGCASVADGGRRDGNGRRGRRRDKRSDTGETGLRDGLEATVKLIDPRANLEYREARTIRSSLLDERSTRRLHNHIHRLIGTRLGRVDVKLTTLVGLQILDRLHPLSRVSRERICLGSELSSSEVYVPGKTFVLGLSDHQSRISTTTVMQFCELTGNAGLRHGRAEEVATGRCLSGVVAGRNGTTRKWCRRGRSTGHRAVAVGAEVTRCEQQDEDDKSRDSSCDSEIPMI